MYSDKIFRCTFKLMLVDTYSGTKDPRTHNVQHPGVESDYTSDILVINKDFFYIK